MTTRRIIGVLLMLGGAALLFISSTINTQVNEGWAKIQQGQSQVNTMDTLFSTNKYTKDAGKMVTQPAQKKINEGRAEATYYGEMAVMLRLAGIGMIIVGGIITIFPSRRRPR